MRDFNECKVCGKFHFSDERCQPLFYYQIPEFHDEDDWSKVRASNFENAAETACLEYDSRGDYSIIRYGGTDEILIKDSMGTIKRFKITAETIPQYSAVEIKEAANA